jgi:hypothetical protein
MMPVPDGCLVRLSGLDLQGKMLLVSACRRDDETKSYSYGDKDPVVNVNEVLFSGVDAIVPGPIPTLLPLRHCPPHRWRTL